MRVTEQLNLNVADMLCDKPLERTVGSKLGSDCRLSILTSGGEQSGSVSKMVRKYSFSSSYVLIIIPFNNLLM